MILETSIEDT